jgi:hypothetical protein
MILPCGIICHQPPFKVLNFISLLIQKNIGPNYTDVKDQILPAFLSFAKLTD